MAERLREKQFGIEPTESAIIDPGAFDTSGIQLANALGELIGESAKFASVLASNAKSKAQIELQSLMSDESDVLGRISEGISKAKTSIIWKTVKLLCFSSVNL